jgi:hypothetical protein
MTGVGRKEIDKKHCGRRCFGRDHGSLLRKKDKK